MTTIKIGTIDGPSRRNIFSKNDLRTCRRRRHHDDQKDHQRLVLLIDQSSRVLIEYDPKQYRKKRTRVT